MPRQRTSSMSAHDFRALRQSTGSTVAEWARDLDCSPQSVRNMESPSATRAEIGRQMAQLAMLVAHPMVRAILPDILRHKEDICKKDEKIP